MKRDIKVKSIPNIRTLEGIPTQDGQIIRPNVLIRSAALDQVTARDAAILRKRYHLRKIIDLRTEDEVTKAPDLSFEKVRYQYLPVCRTELPGISHEVEPGKSGSAEGIPDLRDMYRELVSRPDCIASYREILHAIVNHRQGAVLWHCTLGKDRCGLTTMFVLSLLGVDRKIILQDYRLTNRASMKNAIKYYLLIRIFKKDKPMADKVFMAYAAHKSFLQSAWDEIDRSFGGMDAYLQIQLQITPEMAEAFRRHVLIPR